MEFLKKHYEKIVLVVVLLGLAGAVWWMQGALKKTRETVTSSEGGPPPRTVAPKPIDLTDDIQALAQVTNPPAVVLSGDHNLFNPVTWKRNTNGALLKIIKTGPDALVVTNITPLYTIITFESVEPPIFILGIQSNVDLSASAPPRPKRVHPRMDEKNNSVPFIVRGIKGAETDPSEINLEMTATGDTNVWISKDKPFQQVGSYVADMKYDPEPQLDLRKKKVGDEFKLDNEPYIIVEITKDVVRVQNRLNTKDSDIKWIKTP